MAIYQKQFKNTPHSKEKRRSLRSFPTKAEYVLWQEIRKKKLGYLFRRQFGIGNCIVDFYCDELKLVIEADGPVHEEQKEYDFKRDKFLESQGCCILRFKNDEILFEREKVIEKIKTVCDLERGKLY